MSKDSPSSPSYVSSAITSAREGINKGSKAVDYTAQGSRGSMRGAVSSFAAAAYDATVGRARDNNARRAISNSSDKKK